MTKCDATSINIVPRPSCFAPPHPDVCAFCCEAPAQPAKRALSSGGGGRMRLFNWTLMRGKNDDDDDGGGVEAGTHVMDIATYAAMDEAKAVALFLKQLRVYRHDAMSSFQRAAGGGNDEQGGRAAQGATVRQKRNRYNQEVVAGTPYTKDWQKQRQREAAARRSLSADNHLGERQGPRGPPVRVVSKRGRPAQMRSVSDLDGHGVGVVDERKKADRPHAPVGVGVKMAGRGCGLGERHGHGYGYGNGNGHGGFEVGAGEYR